MSLPVDECFFITLRPAWSGLSLRGVNHRAWPY